MVTLSHHPQNDQVATQRFTSEEKRALERIQEDMYSDFRRAAEAHRYRALCTCIILVVMKIICAGRAFANIIRFL